MRERRPALVFKIALARVSYTLRVKPSMRHLIFHHMKATTMCKRFQLLLLLLYPSQGTAVARRSRLQYQQRGLVFTPSEATRFRGENEARGEEHAL